MKLTREQAAAALLILAGGGAGTGAGGGAGGAGGTAGSSAGNGKAGGGGAALPGQKPLASGGGGKKVSTTAGAAYYHLPIGALIIAHGKTTMTTGASGPGSAHGIAPGSAKTAAEPETMPKGWIPEAKWLQGQAEWEAIWKANEWKGHGSRHIWASGHMFSVPHDADVYVPHATDTASDHDVAEAEKIVVIGKPGAGKAAKLMPNGQFEEMVLNDHLMDGLKGYGTKMPAAGTPHLPVQPEGAKGATHWVPEGWHVYQAPGVANYLYARSPDGLWHTVSKSGVTDWGPANAMNKVMDAKLAAGTLNPYEHPTLHAEHQPPPQEPQGPGPLAGNTTVAGTGGPVDVSYGQVAEALALLEKDGSTQVKLPLQHGGNPLAGMDYHAISKQEIKNFPELKLAPGSKQKHVGQVKVAILHYLARLLDEQPKTDAEQALADAVPDQVADQVSHSYEIAPTTITLGGAEKEVKAPGPEPAPQPELKALAAKVMALPKTPPGSVVTKEIGGVKVTAEDIQAAIQTLEEHPTSTAIKQILKGAGSKLKNIDYWAVIHAYEKQTGIVSKGKAREQFIAALKGYLAQTQQADAASGTDAWKALDGLLAAQKAPEHEMVQHPAAFGKVLAKALLQAHGWATTRYVVKSSVLAGKWNVTEFKPSPGGSTFYTVTPELHVHFEQAGGHKGEWTVENVLAMAMYHLSSPEPAAPEPVPGPAAPGPAPEPPADDAQALLEKAKREAAKAEKNAQAQAKPAKPRPKPSPAAEQPFATQISVTESGKTATYDIPAGTKVYALSGSPKAQKWAVYPDGTWHYFDAVHQEETTSYQHHADSGVLVLADGQGKPEPPKAESVHQQIGALVLGKTSGDQTWGLGKPLSVKLASALIQSAEEDNHYFTAQQLAGHALSGPFKGKTLWVVPSDGGGWQVRTTSPPAPDTQFFYTVHPNGKVWMGGFQAEDTPVSPEDVLTTLKGETALENSIPATAGPPVQVTVANIVAGEVPSGSVIYTGKAAGAGNVLADEVSKYVKKPDGSWSSVVKGQSQLTELGTSATLDGEVASGDLVPFSDKLAAAKEMKVSGPAQDTAKAQGTPPEAQPGIKLIAMGKIVKDEAPAGSVLYQLKGASANEIYIKKPDGSWAKATQYGISNQGTYTADLYAKHVEAGKFVKVKPPAQEELDKAAEVAKYQLRLRDGTVDPAHVHSSWQHVLVDWLANGTTGGYGSYDTAYAYQNDAGKWEASTWNSGDSKSYIKINRQTLDGIRKAADGTELPLPTAEVRQAIDQILIPDAVVVEVAGQDKVIKFGNYYNLKGKGTYLEVKTGEGDTWGYHAGHKFGSAAQATYIWHKQDGTSGPVTPTYAAKRLETATDFHPPGETVAYEPKGGAKTGTGGAKYATAYTSSGEFKVATAEGYPDNSVTLYADGSAKLHLGSGQQQELTGTEVAAQLLGSGAVLDGWANTVIKPGSPPVHYYVLGSKLTPQNVSDLVTELEKASGDAHTVKQLIQAWLPEFTPGKAVAFLDAKSPKDHTYGNAGTSILNLLREMQLIGENKLAAPEPFEPTFLKSLPPGIAGPQDVFVLNAKGYARPPDTYLPEPGSNLAGLSSPDLLGYIKALSGEFGDSKVAGTHAASLSKGDRVLWLKAWQAGDMAKVFNLDAQSGKVSPAHPGAPGNAATHKIIWAPWGQDEVPAGQAVEGSWSDPGKVTLPKAEVANYIIKAGLAHAEYLSDAQKRQWVLHHRKGDQYHVDQLSRIAAQAHDQGFPVQSEVPAWTDNIQPAKSYDAAFEEKLAAGSWTYSAVEDFYADHYDDLLQPLDEDGWGKNTGYQSHKMVLIQRYLDYLKAKDIEEKSKPVWALDPSLPVPAATHEVFWITSTVPLTGAVKKWLFKPVQPGKEFIAEQAHYASRLGKMWGFNLAESQLMTFEGSYGQAQVRLPAVGDLEYGASLGFYDHAPIPWPDLSQNQLSDIAREHVLDWALDNNDSRAANFLILDTGRIVGIDKDRSWRDFGSWDGLSGNGSADSQSALVSTALYNAIRAHDISQEAAAKTYIDVIQRARKMQALSDDKLREVLEKAFEHRAKFGHQTREQVIKAAVARKNSLEKDFTKLYAKVFKDAGYTLPEVPVQKLPAAHDGTVLHSGLSEPDFTDHVHEAGPHGVPAFFGGNELEHNHILVWKEYAGAGTGSPVIKGQTAARGKALAKLVAWAQAHQAQGSYNTKPKPPGKSFVKNASAWYDAVINAAKTISHHQADQQFNQSKLDALTHAGEQMAAQLVLAESVLNSGDAQKLETFTTVSGFGTPEANIAAVKYYQQLAAKVLKGKEDHYKFKAGELPDWTPPAALPEPAKGAPEPAQELKAVLKTPVRPQSIHGMAGLDSDGELHTGPHHFEYDGEQAWHVALPDGEEVVIWDGEGHVEKAHFGRVEFTASAGDGAASLERIRAFLQTAGLDLHEAEEHDLELHYWRHLANVMADRQDGSTGKYGKVWTTLDKLAGAKGVKLAGAQHTAKADTLASAGLDPQDELAVWRAAFANITSPEQVAQFTEAKGWMPRLRHWDLRHPAKGVGNPYYLRFDASLQEILDHSGKTLPTSKFSAAGLKSVLSGGLHSRDERIRMLGTDAADGMGNEFSYGSTNYVYTRLHKHVSSGSDIHAVLSPSILAHTTTYGFDGDEWGNIDKRSYMSYFSTAKAADLNGHSNETMVREGISLLDEVEFLFIDDSYEREKIIQALADLGIYEIRGVPVAERILVVGDSASAAMATVKAAMKAENYGWNW